MTTPSPHADAPRLELFVSGADDRAASAEAAARQVARRLRASFQVFDVGSDHDTCKAHGVQVTPTLRFLAEGGERRVFGDLEDAESVASALAPDDAPRSDDAAAMTSAAAAGDSAP